MVSVHISEGVFVVLNFLMGLLLPISPFLNLFPKVGRRQGLENVVPNFSISQNTPRLPLLPADFRLYLQSFLPGSRGEVGAACLVDRCPSASNVSSPVENRTSRNCVCIHSSFAEVLSLKPRNEAYSF